MNISNNLSVINIQDKIFSNILKLYITSILVKMKNKITTCVILMLKKNQKQIPTKFKRLKARFKLTARQAYSHKWSNIDHTGMHSQLIDQSKC